MPFVSLLSGQVISFVSSICAATSEQAPPAPQSVPKVHPSEAPRKLAWDLPQELQQHCAEATRRFEAFSASLDLDTVHMAE